MNISKKYFYVIFINSIIAIIITYVIYKIVFIWLDIYTKHNVYVKIPNLYSLTVNQAKKNLTKLGLHYEIDTSHYNPKYVPYHIFNFVPQAGRIVKPGRVIFIQANANTFNFIKLPNIILKDKYFALSRLYANHFLVKKIIYVPDINNGLILKVIHNKKYVYSGDILPYKSELSLLVGKGLKKNIVIPNVIGMNLTDAKLVLEKKNIIIGNLFYNEKNYDKNIKNIYRQDPVSGTIIDKKKQYINLWINNKQEKLLNNSNKELKNNFYNKKENKNYNQIETK